MNKKYTIMHKNIKVVDIEMDDAVGYIARIGTVYEDTHLPLGVKIRKNIDRKQLNDWWIGRSIPATRDGIKDVFQKIGATDMSQILTKSLGISLSDHYWIRPENSQLTWGEVNFFDNNFSEDMGDLLFGQNIKGKINVISPDNTSDGWLKKRWKITNSKRMLIKAGSKPFQQEPFNEVVASRLMKRLNIPHVEYNLLWIDNEPYSVCENFVTPETELIPAYRMMLLQKKTNNINSYQHFVNVCKDNKIEIVPFIDRMLTIDYIIANQDRHFNNFGVIRRPDTLEFIGTAPMFDSGTALYYNEIKPQTGKYQTKPFNKNPEKQLNLVTSLEWLKTSKIKDFPEEIKDVFKPMIEAELATEKRVDLIAFATQKAIKKVEEKQQMATKEYLIGFEKQTKIIDKSLKNPKNDDSFDFDY